MNSVLVLDFGAQYGQLIARRIRELGYFSELVPFHTPLDALLAKRPLAIVLSGGPSSVGDPGAPTVPRGLFEAGVPVLGICYGMQLMAAVLGGRVQPSGRREYGRAELHALGGDLFAGYPERSAVWMSHGDLVLDPPPGFSALAESADCPVAAMGSPDRRLFAVQFHPEVSHTEKGSLVFENFLRRVAGAEPNWHMDDLAKVKVQAIAEAAGDAEAICALSGGVDSAVAAALAARALGGRLHAVFVDHGLLRAGEVEEVRRAFTETFPVDLGVVEASDLFLSRLGGIIDPEAKRKVIGQTFIDVFRKEAGRFANASFLVQGTLYPDVIESGSETAATIKSHHNVGGLPKDLPFRLIEPLKDLFKDEVRSLGRTIGLPTELVSRQPFPGPGLAIRIVGEVTEQRLEMVRHADAIVRQVIGSHPIASSLWQWFAVLPGARSVGVMGDSRTYDEAVVVRAVTSEDGMTADWAQLPHDLLDTLSRRIVGEVVGVNRVLYDVTSKPPGTIEWE